MGDRFFRFEAGGNIALRIKLMEITKRDHCS